MSRRDEVAPETIPEVVEYVEARKMREVFRAQHPGIFDQMDALTGHMNTKMDAANKAVRSREVSCDEWDKYQVQEVLNPDVLYEWAGREGFIQKGGKISKKTVLELDKAQVKAHIASGAIPEEIAEQIITKQPKYHAPKPQ